jgi:bacteriorhodopsin
MTVTIEDPLYETASKAAQVLSGLTFAAFAMFLAVSNSPPVGDIQKKTLAERLQAATTLCFLVSIFSAFFNFFQVTEWDNVVLDNRSVPFVLDIARPVEWICTCPIMQLALVIYGGKCIPTYRRILMPLLSVSVLTLGTAAAMTQEPEFLRYILAGIACVVCTVMFALNRYQIVEFSDGKEDLWRGKSDFHKVTVLLIMTWFPFPIWFALSPELFGVIHDVMIIQIGYAILNIVSKISFMAFLQLCRMKASREVQNSIFHAIMAQEKDGKLMMDGKQVSLQTRSQMGVLHAVVTDALVQHGWGSQVERFLNLLKHADIRSLDDILALTEEKCDQKVLPMDMVLAVQSRLKKYKIEERDVAADELEASEMMYNTEKGKAELRKRAMGGMDPAELIEKVGQVVGTLFDQKMKMHEESMKESLNRGELQKEFRELKHHIDTSINNATSRIENVETVVASLKEVLAGNISVAHQSDQLRQVTAPGQNDELTPHKPLIKMARQVETALQNFPKPTDASLEDMWRRAKHTASSCTTQIESLCKAIEDSGTSAGQFHMQDAGQVGANNYAFTHNGFDMAGNAAMSGHDAINGPAGTISTPFSELPQTYAHAPFGVPGHGDALQPQAAVRMASPSGVRGASPEHTSLHPQSKLPPVQPIAPQSADPQVPLQLPSAMPPVRYPNESGSPRGLGNSFTMSSPTGFSIATQMDGGISNDHGFAQFSGSDRGRSPGGKESNRLGRYGVQ